MGRDPSKNDPFVIQRQLVVGIRVPITNIHTDAIVKYVKYKNGNSYDWYDLYQDRYYNNNKHSSEIIEMRLVEYEYGNVIDVSNDIEQRPEHRYFNAVGSSSADELWVFYRLDVISESTCHYDDINLQMGVTCDVITFTNMLTSKTSNIQKMLDYLDIHDTNIEVFNMCDTPHK